MPLTGPSPHDERDRWEARVTAYSAVNRIAYRQRLAQRHRLAYVANAAALLVALSTVALEIATSSQAFPERLMDFAMPAAAAVALAGASIGVFWGSLLGRRRRAARERFLRTVLQAEREQYMRAAKAVHALHEVDEAAQSLARAERHSRELSA